MSTKKHIQIYTLFSGSSGNCTYINCGGTEILIDAGAYSRATEKALNSLGSSLSSIKAVLVTHEHSDHIKGLPVISGKYRIPVYAESACALKIKGVEPFLLNTFTPGEEIEIGPVAVSSFRTFHDSSSCCGFVVKYSGHSFGYATDTGRLSDEIYQSLLPCSAVILEANYDRDMLFSGSYPHFLKLRIASDIGHLDNDRSAELCAFLASHNTKRVLLSHLSAENNTPEAALRAVQRSLADCSCQLSVDIAQRFMPTELVDLYV